MVPHTHWDREWYAPFEAYRYRLVALLDELLPRMEADPAYLHFMLDGQMAMVDDYLEIRPEAEPALRRLAGSGRLGMGPWYVLMDEFAVSGETLVRNLQMGIARATAFGGAMPVGYLPDMFGHVAQMPQLLRHGGLAHAVVWRGVPDSVTKTGFWWRSPDGTTVRAEYLPTGYGNGASLPEDPTAMLRRVSAHLGEIGPFAQPDNHPILLMNGTDHQMPQPWLPSVLSQANKHQDELDFEITSLADYLRDAPTDALPSWEGELRSGARANLLMGVASNRVDVKVAAAVAERTLEHLAEPLAAVWLPPERWPTALFEQAWLQVVRNSAHDSVCACSVDEVAVAVLHRYFEAIALGKAIAAESMAWAGLAMSSKGPVVLNSSARTASGVVEVDVAGTIVPPGAQIVSAASESTTERTGKGADLARLLAELAAQGWLVDGNGTTAAVTSSNDGVELSIEVDRSAPTDGGLRPVAPVMAEASAAAGAAADKPLHLRVSRRASMRVVARVEQVPGFGWSTWKPSALGVAPVAGGHNWLDNGLVHLAVNPADGTFSLNGLSGLDRLVDGGDEGDTYNYSPPAEDSLVERPDSVSIETVEAGPVRGRLRVIKQFRWPSGIRGGRRVGSEPTEVVSDLELLAGDRLVRVEARFDNRSRDHRLRSWFALPERASYSEAECAFAVVRRGMEASGGPHERALATFPSRRFVSAAGLTLTHEGLLEYELVDGGWALALTLLRATGVLSRPAPSFRPNAAGPATETPGAQMLGPRRVRYAVVVGEADPFGAAERAWLPLQTVTGSGSGNLPPEGSALEVQGAEVSSLRRVAGSLELRVFNPSGRAACVRVRGKQGWLVDLRGRPLQVWSESFALAPWAIATARLAPPRDSTHA